MSKKRKKKSKWYKVVIVIILLEFMVGGILFAYKKLKQKPDNEISVKDKIVQELYQKIAHEDIEILDIMSKEAMLYYGYHNVEQLQSINCEVVKIVSDTTGYQCDKMTTFIPKEELLDAVEDVYGPNVTVELSDFMVDSQHYAFVDEVNQGVVLLENEEPIATDPINLKLAKAEQIDEKIILTTQVLDGIYGMIKSTYKYTFEKNNDAYYLIKKEQVND